MALVFLYLLFTCTRTTVRLYDKQAMQRQPLPPPLFLGKKEKGRHRYLSPSLIELKCILSSNLLADGSSADAPLLPALRLFFPESWLHLALIVPRSDLWLTSTCTNY